MTKWADRIKGMVLNGWGDDILYGFLIESLEKVTPQQVYESIRDNVPLLDTIGVSSKDRRALRDAARHLPASVLSAEGIIKELHEDRPDLVSIVINHPKGVEWLERQVQDIRKQNDSWQKVDTKGKA